MIVCMKICIVISSLLNVIHSAAVKENTIEQVHVVFRHGDRTPDALSMYPNDPHINDTWYPYGLGALTNLGKKQEYNLGRALRKKYNDFLGEIYNEDILDARSTSISRAKQSLQLVLAGLWPPNKSQTFVKDLPWQPIPYSYEPFETDEVLGMPLFQKCERYMKEYIKVISSDKVENFLQNNKDKIDYINEKSGLNAKTLLNLFILYFGLYAEEHTNRTLPKWTEAVYPEFLESVAKLEYQLQSDNDEMLKYTGGPLVKKVLTDMRSKIEGKLKPAGLKMFLYSGHEYNIAHTLAALKAFKPHVPDYGSFIAFELHKINSEYGVKIYHQDTIQENPKIVIIPGCEEFCPIKQFEMLTKDVVPGPEIKCHS